MAGGGTTLDVCLSMGRRCLAYDLQPTRPDIQSHDIRHGFPSEGVGCDLNILRSPLSHNAGSAVCTGWDRKCAVNANGYHFSKIWHIKPLRLCGQVAIWRCFWLPRPRKTFHEDLAILTTHFWVLRRPFAPVSSLSDGSVAQWTVPTYRSTCGEHVVMVVC